MEERFGRSAWFVVHDDETDQLQSIDNSEAQQEAHGAGPRTARHLADYGASVLITGNGPGGNAATVLSSLGMDVYEGAGGMSVREANAAYRCGKLRKLDSF